MVRSIVPKTDSAVISEPTAFDADFLASLEKLDILTKKMFRGKLRGEKRSKKLGQSVEFHDFRQYLPGDDIRRIDWNLYARLEKYFIKLFVEEEDMTLYILVDVSKSMASGTPDKFNYGKRIAAALAYLALSNLERVQVAVFDAKLDMVDRPMRGKNRFKRLFEVIAKLEVGSQTSLVGAISQFIAHKPQPGVIVVISDFLFPNPTQALSGLAGRGNQVALIQILSPTEIRPDLAGDLQLVDSETGVSLDVSMGAGVLKKYIKNLEALQGELRSWAKRTGSDYVLIPSSMSLVDVFFKKLNRLIVR